MIRIDTSELTALAADLGRVPLKVAREIPAVVTKGAMNIKDQLRSDLAGSIHFKGASRSVGFDVLDGGFAAEIGPSSEAGSPGNIANIAYFGGSHGGGGTVADPRIALDAEAPKFESALAAVVAKALS